MIFKGRKFPGLHPHADWARRPNANDSYSLSKATVRLVRAREGPLKKDLSILFARDLGPAINAVESFGASPRLRCQRRHAACEMSGVTQVG
jgi:hypothetical protein